MIVVGASQAPEKLGAVMAASLDASELPIARINPRITETGFFATPANASEHIRSAGGQPDLAVLCVPAAATPETLAACADAGIGGALVCSGGFSEIGEDGAALEARVRDELRRSGIRLIGPNTSGFIVPGRRLRASFVPGVETIQAGSIGVVAASGGVNHMLGFRLAAQGAGVSLGVGLGTGIDVGHAEVLRYLATDPQTSVIVAHIETVDDGEDLLDAVRYAVEHKPVVAFVVGRNNVSEFAQSHTGALATSWRTARSVLAHAGAVVVDSEEQLIAAAIGLSRGRIQATARPGVALITGQAGPGLIVADELASRKAELPSLSRDTQQKLAELLPPLTYQANPVDTGRPGATFPAVIAAVASDPATSVLGIYGIAEAVLDMVGSVEAAESELGVEIPAIVSMDGPVARLDEVRAAARAAGIPVVSGALALAQALAAVVDDARAQAGVDTLDEAHDADIDRRERWNENAVKRLLTEFGIATPKRLVARTRDELAGALSELDGPVAAKILSDTVLHKTDVGGVKLNLVGLDALEAAFEELQRVEPGPVLVEEMAGPGVDLIVGARRDPVFGPVVLLGVGGTAAEAIGDVAIRSAPLGMQAAGTMADDLIAKALLDGWRGSAVVQRADLAACIVRIGGLLAANDWIEEIEINPLRGTEQGLMALDAVLVVRKDEDVDTHS